MVLIAIPFIQKLSLDCKYKDSEIQQVDEECL
ncbi:hypothetical protein GvMRE_IIg124 [endosymbiont GvMRE of Glomus versiforme]|nr:hypothetical protein GvMRE_IIg124 [endosymbiont GvMRE of Glomus versiforme]